MRSTFKPITVFVGSRYVVYALQFIRGIAIAAALGPSLYGIWGFLMLVQSYLIYGTLGCEFALNVILSTEQDVDKKKIEELIGTSFLLMAFVSAILILLGAGIQLGEVEVFSEFRFQQFTLLLSLMLASTYFQQVLINVYRFYGLLQKIVFIDLFSTCLTIIPIFLFNSESLVSALLAAFVLVTLLSNAMLFHKPPVQFRLHWNVRLTSYLLSLSIPLLIYNVAANLMTLLSRTVVSAYYSVEFLGLYTFAFNIANSVFLGLSAISWAIFPGLLSGMREGLDDQTVSTLARRTNNLYGTTAFLIVTLASAAAPVLFSFLPKYRPSLGVVGVLLLSQGVGATALGYGSLIYSRRKIFVMTMLNVAGSVTGISLAILGASLGLELPWIAVAMIIGQLVQLLLLVRVNAGFVRFEMTYRQLLAEVFSPGRVAAGACVIVGISLEDPIPWNILAACCFIFLERKAIKEVYDFVVEHSRT